MHLDILHRPELVLQQSKGFSVAFDKEAADIERRPASLVQRVPRRAQLMDRDEGRSIFKAFGSVLPRPREAVDVV